MTISPRILGMISRPRVGVTKDTASSVARRTSDVTREAPGAAAVTQMHAERNAIAGGALGVFVPPSSQVASMRGYLMPPRKVVADDDIDSTTTDIRRVRESAVSVTALASYKRANATVYDFSIVSNLGYRPQPGSLFVSPIREKLGQKNAGPVDYDGYDAATAAMTTAVSLRAAAVIDLPAAARAGDTDLQTRWGRSSDFVADRSAVIGGVAVTARNPPAVFERTGLTDQLMTLAVAKMTRPGKTLAGVQVRFGAAPLPSRVVNRVLFKQTMRSLLTWSGFFTYGSTAGEVSAGAYRVVLPSSFSR